MAKNVGYANEDLNSMSLEEIKLYQEVLLRKQMKYCYSKSEFYKKKFDSCGAKPEDIKTIEDLRKLPIMMTKKEERESQLESLERYGHPFGMHLCAPVEDLILTGTTSGTTGIPTFSYTFTKNDLKKVSKHWSYMVRYAGVSPGERVFFCYALGIYACTQLLYGIREAGALPIDVDARAGTEYILNMLDLTKPNYFFCTPSFALYLLENAPKLLNKEVIKLGLKALFITGEIALQIPEIKDKIEKGYGCKTYDFWAPGFQSYGISCDSSEYQGLHNFVPDYNLYTEDLVDPVYKEPLEIKNGVIGEFCHTSIDREAVPVIRYAYGDIVQVFTDPCPDCGFTGRRVKVVGRSDDMLKVKGVAIYPGAIRDVIADFIPRVTGECRIVLTEKPPRVVPPLKMKVEYGEGIEPHQFEELIKDLKRKISDKVRINPEIELVPPYTFERSMRKTSPFIKMYNE